MTSDAEPQASASSRATPGGDHGSAQAWIWSRWPWTALAAGTALLVALMFRDLIQVIGAWGREEYSHAYMLPLVVGFFIWQRSTLIALAPVRHTWLGVVVMMLGLGLFLVGDLGTVTTLVQYAFLVVLAGLLIALMGWPAFRLIAPAYLLLFFTVPLPAFLYNNISAELQLISSQLGVAVIRLFGIAVFLEGNVVDLGVYKLQVAEACSGLRYLFPLMALGYISAYIFRGALWQKAVLFLSTIPIAILMNGIRIGIIGVLVEHGGVAQAEGFLHDFEGWLVFMGCAVLLGLLMMLLAKLSRPPMRLGEVFAIEGPLPVPAGIRRVPRSIPSAFYVVLVVLAASAIGAKAVPRAAEVVSPRAEFLFFPNAIGEWRGRPQRLDRIYLDALKLEDYLLSEYSLGDGQLINLWIAYYGSQRKGASVHSPRSCLPGGGWEVQELTQIEVPGAEINGQALRVNRALIQLDDRRELVYYWFQQRGRVVTNEYLVKLWMFWDALVRKRTDGALVRLTTSVPGGAAGDVSEADALLSGFARAITGQVPRFVPN